MTRPYDYVDLDGYTEQERSLWAEHGIIRGPVHDNFHVCDSSCYVATFEWMWVKRDGGHEPMVTDMYVVDNLGDYGQSVILRSDSEWEGSYGSMRMTMALKCHYMGEPWSKLIDVLTAKGKILWQRGGG